MAGSPQNYPRLDDGLLDESSLAQHTKKIPQDELQRIIVSAIGNANAKSSRIILNIPENVPDEELTDYYRKSGRELFHYFLRYCGDPASTAHQCYRRHYEDIAREQFYNRTLQKERMNSGWRYQYIAKDAASSSGRFKSVSDIGQAEADFNVTIGYKERTDELTIYVSVKNRTNTMGGQDWPKAISALEGVASSDRNRTGAYLCVFGIAMEKGQRLIKKQGRTGRSYSVNTEIWKSGFFWPFFTDYSYEEIVQAVLEILIATEQPLTHDPIPDGLIESFGDSCRSKGLIDSDGYFCDPQKLASCMCGVLK